MLDAEVSQQARFERVKGRAEVALGPDGVRRLYQQGSAKAMLPRTYGAYPEVVFLNTAGGLTGGDVLTLGLDLEAGVRAVGTTQTAERAYASLGDTVTLDVTAKVAAGARLHWVPQETILFDASSLRRRTRIEMASDATLLTCEMLVLGRAAMGETVRILSLLDRRDIYRAGRPLLTEALAINGDALAAPGQAALLAGQRAFATVVLAAQGAEDALGQVRQMPSKDVIAASSAWDGKCVIRLAAADAFQLKRAVAELIETLGRTPPPRVWQV